MTTKSMTKKCLKIVLRHVSHPLDNLERDMWEACLLKSHNKWVHIRDTSFPWHLQFAFSLICAKIWQKLRSILMKSANGKTWYPCFDRIREDRPENEMKIFYHERDRDGTRFIKKIFSVFFTLYYDRSKD